MVEESHAMDYLVYAYLQQGENEKAEEQYQYLQTIKKVDQANIFAIAYPFAAIPARIALENKQWSKAANLELHTSELKWERFPWQQSILHFARALGASHTGDLDAVKKELSILQSLHQTLLNKPDEYQANQVMIEIKAAQAWLYFAKGDSEKALALMKVAADMEEKTGKHPVTPGEVLPARELLGDLLLALNKPAKALESYEKNLKGHPNRFNGIYGAAIATKKIGDEEKAKMYFNQLIKLTESSASDRQEVKEARAYVGQKES